MGHPEGPGQPGEGEPCKTHKAKLIKHNLCKTHKAQQGQGPGSGQFQGPVQAGQKRNQKQFWEKDLGCCGVRAGPALAVSTQKPPWAGLSPGRGSSGGILSLYPLR